MKREVERERKLPAFSLCIGDLELLWNRLSALFDSTDKIYTSIDIRLPSEQLEFADVGELKQYGQLRGKVTKFTLRLSQNGRRVSIRAGGALMSQAEVTASAETEVWCAGAIETVVSFVHSHKVWYSWFITAPIGWLFVAVGNAPSIAFLFMPKGATIDKALFYAWLTIVLALAFLYFARGKLLPSAFIRISEEDGFIRRRGPELSLLIALISAVLTIIGWFVTK